MRLAMLLANVAYEVEPSGLAATVAVLSFQGSA